jgi:gas vesicle protein
MKAMTDRTYYSQEAQMRAQTEQAVGTALLFALAMGLGAVLTLLFVQNSGEETRDQISDMVDDRLDDGRETLKRLEKEYDNLRKKVEEVLQK